MIWLSRAQRARGGLGEIVSLRFLGLCSCGVVRLESAGPDHAKCEGMKLCGGRYGCKRAKPLSAFSPERPGGRPEIRCRDCRNARRNAQARLRRATDPEYAASSRADVRARRAADRAFHNMKRRASYQRHRERELVKYRAKYLTDPEYRSQHLARNRANKARIKSMKEG